MFILPVSRVLTHPSKGRLQITRNFYDSPQTSQLFDSHRQKLRITHQIAKAINGIGNLKPDTYCLSVGCGTCAIDQLLSSKNIVGLDSASEMLKIAEERVSRTVLGYAQKLPFESGTFDVTYAIDITPSGLSDFNLTQIIAEMKRVTKPKGTVILASQNYLVQKILSLGKNRSVIRGKIIEDSFLENGLKPVQKPIGYLHQFTVFYSKVGED